MWRFSSALLKPIAVLLGIVSVTAVSAARADEPRLSISGYDPVAYFADGKPVPGKPEFEHLWHKARWRFASAEHRDLFVKEPNRYTPQYDGYCAMGVSGEGAAHKDSVDPHAWTIIDGKLYLAHSSYWLDVWRENAEQNIKRADAGWLAMVDLAEPVIVGAPCTASPPTTVVALRGGGHWVVVGPQIARDESGNVVGKGDMRAQIEQIGKNVGACLKAGGAAVTSFSQSTTLQSPVNSTNMAICACAISARPRRKAQPSVHHICPTPIFCCRSKPSRRSSNTG
jgi:enamine deaminase RidA (YjgF/YER057c/UK114 family)